MPRSNFPSPFNGGLTLRNVPINIPQPGQVFWVNNSSVLGVGAVGGEDGNPGTYTKPLATLDYAVGKCVANRGDVIYVMPGHAETISSASILTLDVAGVTIIGLGIGSKRPTLTFTTATTATINVTAANITVSNVLHVANFADVATYYTNNAGPEFCVEDCEFRDTSSSLNALTCVTTTVTVNADGLTFQRNKVYSLGTTAATTMIKIAGTISRVYINDNYFVGAVLNNTAALLAHGALVVSRLEMARNTVFRPNTDTATGGILITTSATTNTGMVSDNYIKALDVAAAILVTAGSAYGMTNNLYNGDTDASGFVLPAIGVDGS